MSKKKTSPPATACPCGSGRDYAACCRPCHAGTLPAPTAEALMRSRYSAFAMGDAAYLLRTWHSSTRPAALDLSDDATRWLGLKILATQGGTEHDAEGRVEFVARYKVDGRGGRLHEDSRFAREAGQWVYVAGDVR